MPGRDNLINLNCDDMETLQAAPCVSVGNDLVAEVGDYKLQTDYKLHTLYSVSNVEISLKFVFLRTII